MAERLYTFPRSFRLCSRREVSAVFDGRVSERGGPLVVYGLPNGLAHSRLAIVVGRRVGTAPRRNRIKRLIREAFRLERRKLPGGYDLVIVVRPHEPVAMVGYQGLLGALVSRLDGEWGRRGGGGRAE